MDFFCVPMMTKLLNSKRSTHFFFVCYMLQVLCDPNWMLQAGAVCSFVTVNFSNLKIDVHDANGETFLEAARVNGAILSTADELSLFRMTSLAIKMLNNQELHQLYRMYAKKFLSTQVTIFMGKLLHL